MPTRQQVRRLLADGLDYQAAGARLGIPAGLAYLIATGLPADGSGTPGQLSGPEQADGAQQPASPPSRNPTTGELVRGWIRARVAADPQQRQHQTSEA